MEATLDVVTRETRGKNEARRLRVAGRIPAVIYGDKTESVAVAVDPKALSRILRSESGANTLINVTVPGSGPARVLVKEYQIDPVHSHLLHADFYRVALDRLITVTVSIVIKGESKGVKLQGGVLELPHREVEIEVLPTEIPENLEVDVTEMMIGQHVRLKDLAEGAKWTPVSDPDTMIVHVVPPRAEEPTAAADGTPAVAEPEVIKKGKTEKEGE